MPVSYKRKNSMKKSKSSKALSLQNSLKELKLVKALKQKNQNDY